MPSETADVAATFCATLVDEWVRAGLTDAVVCPGSRSTPMALALAADGRLHLHVHSDERAGGFVALGLGLVAGRPALVLTTSGTAAVELHPAVVEAHHARVPLIAVTADRPAERRDVGAPQTIDQTHLYGRAVRWFHDPGVPDEAGRGSWRGLAARAVLEAAGVNGSAPGPVQLNLPFREPLVGTAGLLPPARAGNRPWLRRPGDQGCPATVDVEALADAVAGRRVLVVAGGGVTDPAAVLAAAELLRWPVVADPRSGCRVPGNHVVAHADAVLRHEPRAATLVPDVVLRLGSPLASKVLGQWLTGLDAWQIGVDRWGAVFDPEGVLDSVVVAEPGALLAAVAGVGPTGAPDGWLRAWARADATAAAALDAALVGRSSVCEPGVARDVLAALPDGSTLVVSSSMPVRDVEWYGVPRSGVRVLANRGANGIDGVVSTAVGVALGTDAPAAVLIGDVAFLHDSNALLGVIERGIDLTIVVVDNRGGGIFSFLPQADALDPDRFEHLFGTPHGVELATLAAAHGLVTLEVHDASAVGDAVRASVAAGGVRMIVVRTDRSTNVAVHDDLHAAVAAALDDR